jgi:aryl-alcohol dehydrogenase-like predicted oxidoreductase
VLARPHVTSVIIGARNQEQIGLALRALDVRLSSAEADVLTQLF